VADPVAVWTAVAAVAATASVVVAYFSARFAWQTLQALNDPKVITYVKHDSNRPSVIVLVIENIGRDIAEDVRFSPSRPIPIEAWGIEVPKGTSKILDEPITHGIPALGPGDPRVYSLGQRAGLLAALGDNPLNLTYTYRRGRRTFEGASCLEIQSFGRLDISEPPNVTTAKAVARIAKSFPE
jgi:hypothetical protein